MEDESHLSPPSPLPSPTTLQHPSKKNAKKPSSKPIRAFRNAVRAFPIIAPVCKFQAMVPTDGHHHHKSGSNRITGTLFGYRKGRVSLAIQENSRTLPMVVLELAIQTQVLQKEMGQGMVRIALESDKRTSEEEKIMKVDLLDEPMWTMYCNGKKLGYAVKRMANEEDLGVMEVLKAVSMGAGVLPSGRSSTEVAEMGELAYMRAYFDRVVAKDSETMYMVSPDGSNGGPDLSIFFVRV